MEEGNARLLLYQGKLYRRGSGADCKSAAFGSGGSTPSLPTKRMKVVVHNTGGANINDQPCRNCDLKHFESRLIWETNLEYIPNVGDLILRKGYVALRIQEVHHILDENGKFLYIRVFVSG
jgi:hypothetical protein